MSLIYNSLKKHEKNNTVVGSSVQNNALVDEPKVPVNAWYLIVGFMAAIIIAFIIYIVNQQGKIANIAPTEQLLSEQSSGVNAEQVIQQKNDIVASLLVDETVKVEIAKDETANDEAKLITKDIISEQANNQGLTNQKLTEIAEETHKAEQATQDITQSTSTTVVNPAVETFKVNDLATSINNKVEQEKPSNPTKQVDEDKQSLVKPMAESPKQEVIKPVAEKHKATLVLQQDKNRETIEHKLAMSDTREINENKQATNKQTIKVEEVKRVEQPIKQSSVAAPKSQPAVVVLQDSNSSQNKVENKPVNESAKAGVYVSRTPAKPVVKEPTSRIIEINGNTVAKKPTSEPESVKVTNVVTSSANYLFEIKALVTQIKNNIKFDNFDGARQSLDKLKNIAGDNSVITLRMSGYMHLKLADYVQAGLNYQGLLQQQPDDMEGNMNMVIVESEIGKKASAIKRLNHLEEIYPQSNKVDSFKKLVKAKYGY